jgi:Tol biopolymer transport system component
VAVGAAVALSIPTMVFAQAPDEPWRTLATEHFRVTFPERLEPLGRRAADRAEWAYDALAEALIAPPQGLIDVLVTDHTDDSNGFAQVVPSNRIIVFARPPVDLLSLGYFDDWMELVILHELAHIVHLDYTRNPIGRLARAMFGRVQAEWPFFPALGTPRWLTEGLATWYESQLTGAGRVRGTFQEMQLRTALLEKRFENIGQASGDSPLWPAGQRPFTYGARFFEYLLERHGDDRMAAFVEAIAGQWVPYRLDAAGRVAFGVSLSDEWDAWEADLEAAYADLDERLRQLGPITEPERLTTDVRWGLHPTVSPDGRSLVYVGADGRSDTELRLDDPAGGSARPLTRTNGLSTFSWMPDGRLLVAQRELDGPYRSYGDLYVTSRSGRQERLTYQARLTDPSVAHDGRSVVAVQQGNGTNGLVRVDLDTGVVTSLVAPEPDVHWAFPAVSPDGRWIAATRWEPNAYTDVVILDAASGKRLHRVTRDRAIDLAPSWSPDSRWLVWASDRTGIANILGAEVDPLTGHTAAPVMLTNVRTGAAFPSLDPTGIWLYYSGYHVDGWDVERTPFLRAAAPAAPAPETRFDPPAVPTRRAATLTAPVQNYSAAPTLRPTSWQIAYRSPIVFPAQVTTDGRLLPRREALGYAIGAETSGRDLVGRHAYSVLGRVFTTSGRVDASVGYSYAGLANPVFSITATQTYNAAGRLPADTTAHTVFILQRERLLEGAVTFRAPAWRRSLSLRVSAGLIRQQRQLLDDGLEPTRQFALTRPTSQLEELGVSARFSTARSHAFQMGITRGVTLFARGRLRTQRNLPDSLQHLAGVDGSFSEVIGRVQAAIPLWSTGRVTHVLAFQSSGGLAAGPEAGPGHFAAGGASGRTESLTRAELFGGGFLLFPVRGYPSSTRFGRYAWAMSAEYRFPLALINRGMRAWPLHVDQVIGSLFFDAGNAWGPDASPSGFQNARRIRPTLTSMGAEITTEILGLYNVALRLRTGVAVPLAAGHDARVYVRVGLPF